MSREFDMKGLTQALHQRFRGCISRHERNAVDRTHGSSQYETTPAAASQTPSEKVRHVQVR